MKLFTGFTRLASKPPWAKTINHDGVDGWWTEFGGKHKVFLNSHSNRVHLPKSLRGKAIVDLKPQDFEMLDKEDSGDTHYKLWREDFDRNQQADKLFTNYNFTALGQVYLDRLFKYLIKCKLDDVSQLGLDSKFSINPNLQQKLLSTPDINKVRSMLKNVAKKYRMIITLLEDMGQQKLAKKYDKDFYYQWAKLEPLAQFDPASYKPKAEAKDRDDEEEVEAEDNVALHAKNQFLKDVAPLLDAQFGELIQAIEALSRSVDDNNLVQAELDLEHMVSCDMALIGRLHGHPLGQKAEAILQLPSLILLHDKLVGK